MIIAIDGPAGAGKSTVARAVAAELHFAYINTGAMYRAVALVARENGWNLPQDEEQIVQLGAELPLRFGAGGTHLLIGTRDVTDDIASPEIGSLASQVASCRPLRANIVARQKEFGHVAEDEIGGAVLEGRDIQTVVFPDAPLKIFLTAGTEARAHRRYAQWQEKGYEGEEYSLDRAARDVEERDLRDSKRDVSPLQPAEDAVFMLTDDLSLDEVITHIVDLARERGAQNGATVSQESRA